MALNPLATLAMSGGVLSPSRLNVELEWVSAWLSSSGRIAMFHLTVCTIVSSRVAMASRKMNPPNPPSSTPGRRVIATNANRAAGIDI